MKMLRVCKGQVRTAEFHAMGLMFAHIQRMQVRNAIRLPQRGNRLRKQLPRLVLEV
jgi:hypothetical protein